MKIEVDVDDGKVRNLSANAHVELKAVSKKYLEDILDEASRLEVARNSTSNTPEITASIIKDAVDFTNKFKKPKRKVFLQVILQTLSFAASTFTGALFQIDKFNEASNVYWFLGVFLVAILLNVVVYFNDYHNE